MIILVALSLYNLGACQLPADPSPGCFDLVMQFITFGNAISTPHLAESINRRDVSDGTVRGQQAANQLKIQLLALGDSSLTLAGQPLAVRLLFEANLDVSNSDGDFFHSCSFCRELRQLDRHQRPYVGDDLGVRQPQFGGK